jgi:calcium/calmodulin-dependent protein kinase I
MAGVATEHKFTHIINKISGQPASYSKKSNYTFGKTLGAGSFGIVRYARDNTSDEEVAIKIILKKALKGNEDMVLDELRLLQQLNHPHIVGFRDWYESKDKFYIVTQLATGGELFDRIVSKGKFTEHDASVVIIQMLEALQYLHDRNIVHRDLKPENILYLSSKEDSNVVLADFGIAKHLQDPDDKLYTSAGSFGYAAPEVITGDGHGKPCDIWSLGVITYTLLCGYSPFRSENVQDFINEVRHNNGVIFHADYWRDVSKDARRFIINVLQYNPKKRPTATQLLNDPWIVSIASEHKDADLLPMIKQGFDGRAKFRQAIELVRLHNRIKKLKEIQTEEDDDPLEIGLFGDSGPLATPTESEVNIPNPLMSWSKMSQSLKDIEQNDSSRASLSPIKSPYKDSKVKSTLTGKAFVQLVQTASKNKERVRQFQDSEKKETSSKESQSSNQH